MVKVHLFVQHAFPKRTSMSTAAPGKDENSGYSLEVCGNERITKHDIPVVIFSVIILICLLCCLDDR